MPDQTIIALSGRKGSGKNTVGDFIARWYFERYVLPRARIHDETLADKVSKESIYVCSFADNLKQFCIETLGLSHEACYGTEEQKNAPTQYRWEDASPFYAWKFGTREINHFERGELREVRKAHSEDSEQLRQEFYADAFSLMTGGVRVPTGHRTGYMSGRDIMQLFGTELIRETFGNVWAAATIRSIKRSGKPLGLITDNRFPNEVATVLAEPRGYIIRLTRSPYGYGDRHPSEASLDGFNWERDRCFVVNNDGLDIDQQNSVVAEVLEQIFDE